MRFARLRVDRRIEGTGPLRQPAPPRDAICLAQVISPEAKPGKMPMEDFRKGGHFLDDGVPRPHIHSMENKQPVPASNGERAWRVVLFVLSAAMAASALVDFDAGRMGKGLGDLGVAVLMLSMMVQFPFLRAIVKASGEEENASPERVRKQREELMKQAEQVRSSNPWADYAGRAGWALLAISLILRIGGVA